MQPETRYAKSGDVHIAYQVFGQGPVDLVLSPPFVSNVEYLWTHPDFSRWFLRLGDYVRVAMFDKRGTGMSDRVTDLAGLDERMDDIRAVMDATGMKQAALLGICDGRPMSALFAATHPDRCRALVPYGSPVRSPLRSMTPEAFAALLKDVVEPAWGSGISLPLFAASLKDDPAMRDWWARFERLGASPAAVIHLMRMNYQIDISDIVETIRVPTLVIHRRDDANVNVENGRFLAAHIPGARYIELPGIDHMPGIGDNAMEIADAIGEFLTGAKAPVATETVLATVLFTDIVGSTEIAVRLGDHRWRDLLDQHNSVVRQTLTRFRGREIKCVGDGFVAAFDGPGRGVRCACAIADEVHTLGVEVRCGLHTGECELMDGDYRGVAVHIAARVEALAGPNEVLASSTVKDLVAGSGLRFSDRGSQRLKGVPGEWRIYAVDR